MTIPGLLQSRAEKTPDAIAHFTMSKSGDWQSTSWQVYYEKCCALNHGLRKIGVKPGDTVGIMAATSQTWDFVQMGIMMCGGVIIGIDISETKENVNHVVRMTKLSGIVIQHPELLLNIDQALIDAFNYVLVLEKSVGTVLKEKYYALSDLDHSEKSPLMDAERNSLATIICTSGTTGKPKGVGYTHEQVVLTCNAILKGFPDIVLSSKLPCWLPLSNLFQRIINFCAIELGSSSYYIEDPRSIIKMLPEIEPHLFIGVPRIFEKLYAAIDASIQKKPFLQKTVINLAIKSGDRFARSLRAGERLSPYHMAVYRVMDRLVLKKIRAFMGGKLYYMISGSAPMPVWMLERFHALGILILEAYGVSENIIPVAMNTPANYKFGTVGKPLSDNTIRILEDGELYISGNGVINSYYNGNSPLTDDCFYPTGDYVSIDEEGYLKIVGRKSEVFKTSTGKKISPVVIEKQLQKSTAVDHAVIFGKSRKVLTALITLSAQFKQENAIDVENGITNQILDKLAATILAVVKELPGYQQPAAVLISDSEFTVETGELTSNLKLKRNIIEDRNDDKIELIYQYLEGEGKSDALYFYDAGIVMAYKKCF